MSINTSPSNIFLKLFLSKKYLQNSQDKFGCCRHEFVNCLEMWSSLIWLKIDNILEHYVMKFFCKVDCCFAWYDLIILLLRDFLLGDFQFSLSFALRFHGTRSIIRRFILRAMYKWTFMREIPMFFDCIWMLCFEIVHVIKRKRKIYVIINCSGFITHRHIYIVDFSSITVLFLLHSIIVHPSMSHSLPYACIVAS